MACENCRAKKIRCDSARPSCRHCDQRSLSCVYINERQKRQKLSGSEIEERFRHLESLVGQRAAAPETQGTTQLNGETEDASCEVPSVRCEDAYASTHRAVSSATPPASPIYGRAPPARQGEDCHDPALWLRLVDGDEYTGPSSGISLLSVQGLEWIHEKLGESLCLPISTFEELRKNLLNHLRIPKCILNDPWSDDARDGSRTPLPGPAEIWQYIDAYFDSVQIIFPILDRKQFVRHATGYLASPEEDNPSWYALFNAVLASGCRAALATESPEGFSQSGSVAWTFFKNSLAMESNLIHKSTDFTAVQAFTIMTVFAQGLSSPQRLEYTLCSIAARLSHSLGMHRRPAKDWKLDAIEQNERNRVFWIIYCLDKTIALRCGRPSTFDDDDISCEIPHAWNIITARPLSRNDANIMRSDCHRFNVSRTYTELARMHGKVAKRLYSAKALDHETEDLTNIATNLLQDLEAWRIDIPHVIRPGSHFRPSALSGILSLEEGLALHLGYYDIVCAIHRRFSPRFQRHGKSFTLRLSDGMITHIEAAKKIILLTKYLDTQSYSPAWMLFYYPMTALLTVFEHVICDPSDASAKNDIALMEVVVGFFGRLEYLTSGVAAFTKTAEVVKQARIVVEQARDGERRAFMDSVESAAALATGLLQGGLEGATSQEHAANFRNDDLTDKVTYPSAHSLERPTPRGDLPGPLSAEINMSTWSPSWNVSLDEGFDHAATSAAWTQMETHSPEGTIHAV